MGVGQEKERVTKESDGRVVRATRAWVDGRVVGLDARRMDGEDEVNEGFQRVTRVWMRSGKD